MRVVIHQDEEGEIKVYFDKGVTVYWVSEAAPDDRIYRMSPAPIPDGLLEGLVGHENDGSASAVKAYRAAAMMEGESHLTVVKDDTLN